MAAGHCALPCMHARVEAARWACTGLAPPARTRPLHDLCHSALAAGGVFKLELFLPEDYPMAAPKVRPRGGGPAAVFSAAKARCPPRGYAVGATPTSHCVRPLPCLFTSLPALLWPTAPLSPHPPSGSFPHQDLPPQRGQAGPHLPGHPQGQVEPRAADPHRAAQVRRRGGGGWRGEAAACACALLWLAASNCGTGACGLGAVCWQVLRRGASTAETLTACKPPVTLPSPWVPASHLLLPCPPCLCPPAASRR